MKRTGLCGVTNGRSNRAWTDIQRLEQIGPCEPRGDGGTSRRMLPLIPSIDETLRDAKHGLHRWRERPLFALAAIVTIALSTGAATALFSLVDGVLLKPLPYPRGERFVTINRTYPDWVSDPILSKSWDRISFAWPEFFFVRE